MLKRLASWIEREPVRALAVGGGLVPIVTNGLVLFELWEPTIEQLAYVNGIPIAISSAIGFRVVRNRVQLVPDESG